MNLWPKKITSLACIRCATLDVFIANKFTLIQQLSRIRVAVSMTTNTHTHMEWLGRWARGVTVTRVIYIVHDTFQAKAARKMKQKIRQKCLFPNTKKKKHVEEPLGSYLAASVRWSGRTQTGLSGKFMQTNSERKSIPNWPKWMQITQIWPCEYSIGSKSWNLNFMTFQYSPVLSSQKDLMIRWSTFQCSHIFRWISFPINCSREFHSSAKHCLSSLNPPPLSSSSSSAANAECQTTRNYSSFGVCVFS